MSELEKGGCLCGGFKYQFPREAVISAHHCHCKDCQKMTGCGKATILMLPAAALQIEGEQSSYTVTGTDGAHVSRGFCPSCGGQSVSSIEEVPDLSIVRAGSLDDSSWVTIDSSLWASSAQPWSPVDPNNPSFEKNPEM
jgi:hypothetical protein